MKIGLLDSGKGIIPFIKEILFLKKKHHFYLFIDQEFFPYGTKTKEELISRMEFLAKQINEYQLDLLLICCNSLSYIYLLKQYHVNCRVDHILSYNLIYPTSNLLTTSFLASQMDTLDGHNLPYLIEKGKIKEIILFLKKIKQKDLVLSCTHYHLVKNVMEQMGFNILSLEKLMIERLPSGYELCIFIKAKDYLLIKNYFVNQNIFHLV